MAEAAAGRPPLAGWCSGTLAQPGEALQWRHRTPAPLLPAYQLLDTPCTSASHHQKQPSKLVSSASSQTCAHAGHNLQHQCAHMQRRILVSIGASTTHHTQSIHAGGRELKQKARATCNHKPDALALE